MDARAWCSRVQNSFISFILYSLLSAARLFYFVSLFVLNDAFEYNIRITLTYHSNLIILFNQSINQPITVNSLKKMLLQSAQKLRLCYHVSLHYARQTIPYSYYSSASSREETEAITSRPRRGIKTSRRGRGSTYAASRRGFCLETYFTGA